MRESALFNVFSIFCVLLMHMVARLITFRGVCVYVCIPCQLGDWYDYTPPTVETLPTVDIPSWLSSIS